MTATDQKAPNGASEPAGLTSVGSINEVRLLGRLSAPLETRSLPSGDVLATFRVVVDRLETDARSRAKVDVVDCVVWRARLRRQAAGWNAGDVVEISGALRRRFYRTAAGGTSSTTEVEVVSGRLRRRAST